MCWIDEKPKQIKKKPGPKKKPESETRKTVHATVHPNVVIFWNEWRDNPDTGPIGELIDRLISSKFPHVKIGDQE